MMASKTHIPLPPKAADPYLLWALVGGLLADTTDKSGTTVPILLELCKPMAKLGDAELAVPGLIIPDFYTAPLEKAFEESRFCSALASWAFIQNPPDWVKRLVLAQPSLAHKPRFCVASDNRLSKDQAPILAVIDDGLDFLNARYVDGGKTRFIAVWDQNTGRVHPQSEIQKHLAFGHSLEAYQQFFGHHLGKRTHGSGVLQLASKRHHKAAGMADHHGRPLLAVQLPTSTVRDASGGSLGARALDAMRFVFDQTSALSTGGQVHPVVVNLSMGADAGAHDGSSVFEQAMDELLTLRAHNTAIVLPAGNAHDQHGHLSCTIPANGVLTVDWHVPSQDQTPSFLELWSDAGSHLLIDVTPPQGMGLQAVAVGQQATLPASTGHGVAVMLAHMGANTLSRSRRMALLALAPTQACGPVSACAQAGRYRIAVHNNSGQACPVQLWLERDGPVYGHNNGGKRGHLLKNPACSLATVDTDNTLNSIANGKHTIVVGATQQHRVPLDQTQAASYSGRSSSKAQVLAQGDEGPQNSLRGLAVQETVGQDRFRIGGTSVAAALVSRWLLAYLETSAHDVKNADIVSDLATVARGQGKTQHPSPPDWPQKI